MADAVGAAQVGSERRLTVGSRPHQVEPPARAEQTGAEAGHDVSAFVFKRHRWHRDEDVVDRIRDYAQFDSQPLEHRANCRQVGFEVGVGVVR